MWVGQVDKERRLAAFLALVLGEPCSRLSLFPVKILEYCVLGRED
jgi:hypothetical protein